MLSAVAKQVPGKNMDPKTSAGLRAMVRTAAHPCPDALRESLAATPSDADGGYMWSGEGAERKDFSAAKANWVTLSVLEALMMTGHVRDLDRVFQVASVIVELEAAPVYMACSKCNKAWADPGWLPSQCWSKASAEARIPR